MFTFDQAEELYSVLYNDALAHEIILSEDVKKLKSGN